MIWVGERPAVQRTSARELRAILTLLHSCGFAIERGEPDGPASIACEAEEPSQQKSGSPGSTSAARRTTCQTDDATSVQPCEAAATSARTAQVRVRTLFLSNLHLGTMGCQAELLTDFLRHYEASTIYLVGDIIEARRLTSDRPWSERHRGVVAELLTKARNGTRVIYVPGNHDRLLRRYAGFSFGGIEIALRAVHETAGGQRYLITHGDEFDAVLRHMPWLAAFGHVTYHGLSALNATLNVVRRSLGLGHWSCSAWAKHEIKRAVSYISQFEESLFAQARRHGAQGVVCGHIDHAADHDLGGLRCLNTGDWGESCTGLLEHEDGRFELVRWTGAAQTRRRRDGLLRARQAPGRRAAAPTWLSGLMRPGQSRSAARARSNLRRAP